LRFSVTPASVIFTSRIVKVMPTPLNNSRSLSVEGGLAKDDVQDKFGDGIGGGGHDTESATSRKHGNCISQILSGLCKRKPPVEEKSPEQVLELLQPSRYKPHDLDQMSVETKFSKTEVKFLYRAFKSECPNGIIDEDTFKDVYEKIFPMGDSSKYAQIVFKAIDSEKTGGITFGDFMHFLSVISKGTEREKILWSFHFYDLNKDGMITKDEMFKVSESIYELMGSDISKHREYVDRIFQNMDTNKDGIISVQEFVSYCEENPNVHDSLLVLP